MRRLLVLVVGLLNLLPKTVSESYDKATLARIEFKQKECRDGIKLGQDCNRRDQCCDYTPGSEGAIKLYRRCRNPNGRKNDPHNMHNGKCVYIKEDTNDIYKDVDECRPINWACGWTTDCCKARGVSCMYSYTATKTGGGYICSGDASIGG